MPASPPRARLSRLACAALARICPPFAEVGGGTFASDANLGVDIPATRDEALSAALRLGVETLCYGEERIRLDAGTRANLLPDLDVRLSPIVSGVEDSADAGAVVSFKRYLPEKALGEEEARLVAPLRSGDRLRLRTIPMMADGQSIAEVESKLRKLEAEHIVRLDVRPP